MKPYQLATVDKRELARKLDKALKDLLRRRAKEKPAAARALRAEQLSDIADRVGKIGSAANLAATKAAGIESAMAAVERHSTGARRLAEAVGLGEMTSAEAAHHTEICKALDEIEQRRVAMADLRAEADEHADAIRKHVEAVHSHVAALGGHVETERGLSAWETKRARLIKIASKSEAAQLPRPPAAFRVIDIERQVEAVIASSADCESGWRVLVDGVDLKTYSEARGVCWGHDANRVVAYCLDIKRDGQELVAVAQFPPAGVSYTADACFKAIKRGELRGASISIAIDSERKAADGSSEITAGRLVEWSFVSRAADPFARVTSIGGKAVARAMPSRSSKGPAWADYTNPQPPTWQSAGGTAAGLAQAQAVYEQRRLAARWFMN